MQWTVDQVLKITKGRLIQGDISKVISHFTTDSRSARPGSFFIPLKGPHFDGHQFIEKARQAGSIGFFKSIGIETSSQGICIEVADPLISLQRLAEEVRKNFKGPVVAITGSNGKTTTKEMLSSILTNKIPHLKTEGNLNNHIGLPLTLLNLKVEQQLILLEMGINHPGELSVLCEIAHPSLGLITNIGETHLEGLGTIEGVSEAKGELLDFLDQGIAVLNRDSPFFNKLKTRQKGKVISFGLNENSDVKGENLESETVGHSFTLVYEKMRLPVHLAVSGHHNVLNALGAAAAALMIGISPEDIAEGLSRFRSVPLRTEIIQLKNEAKLIVDAYNANPSSMRAALQMLAEMGKAENRIAVAVLGDMLELGQSSKMAHYQLGEVVGKLKINKLILYGMEVENVRQGAIEHGFPKDSVSTLKSYQAIADEVKKLLSEKPIILIKGSRGMRMEKVLEFLIKE